MSTDFKEELFDIAHMVEPPECAVSPEAIDIAAESLSEIDQKYGPASDNPLSFHNAEHSIGVTRRAIRLINILYPHMHGRPEYREDIYDLGLIGGATHDVEQDLGPGENETASVNYALAKVEESGTEAMKTDRFKKRLGDGIQATAVQMRDDGEIVQVNVQNGTHDPFKFTMSFGDINGIAMEGSRRMFNDATRLCYEIYGDPTLDQLYSFLVSQAGFLRKRLNDGRVKSDIAFYFPDDIEEVYKDMRRAFHSNILSAHGMAVILGERPELKASVAAVLKTLGAVDRSVLGEVIGNTLHRKVVN